MRSEGLARRYRAIRGVTTRLCQTLSAEDCAAQSMPDASPAKWHLAHTSWFFETFVARASESEYTVFHPGFEYLFNSYYNSVGAQYNRPDRGLLTRPSLEEVGNYRAYVDSHLTALLEDPGRLTTELLDIVELGLNHEQQHQELLLTDIKHLLAQNPLAPVFARAKEPESVPIQSLSWQSYTGGVVMMGCDATVHGPSGGGRPSPSPFAFDNESPRHRVFLEPFDLASRPIRNAEFLVFMEEGGYLRPELWMAEGWTKIQDEGRAAPLYWSRQEDRWWNFTLSGLRPVRMDEPVCHISFYEADAFARWAGCRLPTEAEWEHAASETPIEGNFLEGGRFHPHAVPALPNAEGPLQLFGDVWEWTSSAYGPYPGFRAAEGALGEYNGKFMSSQVVLRGGSCVSPRSHLRATYRNFFYPDSRWQFSGVRLARDLAI